LAVDPPEKEKNLKVNIPAKARDATKKMRPVLAFV